MVSSSEALNGEKLNDLFLVYTSALQLKLCNKSDNLLFFVKSLTISFIDYPVRRFFTQRGFPFNIFVSLCTTGVRFTKN